MNSLNWKSEWTLQGLESLVKHLRDASKENPDLLAEPFTITIQDEENQSFIFRRIETVLQGKKHGLNIKMGRRYLRELRAAA